MLNSEHFLRLAGDPELWDAEITHRQSHGEGLSDIQRDQWQRGRRIAELTHGELGSAVRSGMGLDGSRTLSPVFVDRDDAVARGVEWAKADPYNRDFITRKRSTG